MAFQAMLQLLARAWTAHAILYHDATLLPVLEYDFVIIGGGTAGNVLANRLSTSPNISVLVLEAGSSNEGVLNAEIPLLSPTLSPNTPYDWNFTTAPISGFQGRTIPYAQGRILGGSSSISSMFPFMIVFID
jgi:choline dehydrogenase-like flavoprotein